jgi:hypothetical protein
LTQLQAQAAVVVVVDQALVLVREARAVLAAAAVMTQ